MSDQHDHGDLGELGNIILQRANQKTGARQVKLSEIFNLLCKGGTKYIRRQSPEIRPETVALGRAWLIATRPELYKEKIAPNQTGDLRILVDECVSARIIPAIRNGFGFATHANFVGLKGCGTKSGRGDASLWEWALANNIDAVITRDRTESNDNIDLTLITKKHAVGVLARMQTEEGRNIDFNTLPVLIHVSGQRANYQYVSGLLNTHRKRIQDFLHTRIAPVIVVDEKGVKPDVTYLKLWEQAQIGDVPPGPVRALVTKQSRWASEWLKNILAANPAINDNHRDAVTTILKNAAQSFPPKPNSP